MIQDATWAFSVTSALNRQVSHTGLLPSRETIKEALNIDDALVVGAAPLLPAVFQPLALFADFEKVSTLNNSLICSSAMRSVHGDTFLKQTPTWLWEEAGTLENYVLWWLGRWFWALVLFFPNQTKRSP